MVPNLAAKKQVNLDFLRHRTGDPAAVFPNGNYPPLGPNDVVHHGFTGGAAARPAAFGVRQLMSRRTHGAQPMRLPNDYLYPIIKHRLNKTARRMWRAGMRYRRILNWGGEGVLTLFEFDDDNTPPAPIKGLKDMFNKDDPEYYSRGQMFREVVVKFNKMSGAVAEEIMLTTLRRAPHIIRVVGIDKDRYELPARRRRAIKAWERSAHPHRKSENPPHIHDIPERHMLKVHYDNATLMLEYLRNGNLHAVLAKARWEGERKTPHLPQAKVDNAVLWGILDCLVHGCQAMEYPPRDQGPRGRNGYDERGQPLPELPPAHVDAGYRRNIVHFDIDPTNILVDDVPPLRRADEHSGRPKLKLSDFGSSVWIRNGIYTNKNAWDHREMGKEFYMAPEQWTKEWEKVTWDPTRVPGLRIAGRFNAKTNVFQAGCILYACITQTDPAIPPWAEQVDVTLADGTAARGYSHGYSLTGKVGLEGLDPALLSLVQRCLMYYPDERPTLRELRQACDAALAALTMPARQRRRNWWNRMIGVPVEPTPVRRYLPTQDLDPNNELDEWYREAMKRVGDIPKGVRYRKSAPAPP